MSKYYHLYITSLAFVHIWVLGTNNLSSHSVSDPRSAPVSPSPLRKAPSQTEQDISAPGTPSLRSGSGARRKLGSRHGWGLGLARGGSGVSQSFSPGDHKTPPLLRVRSDHSSSSVLWEGQGGETNTDAPLNSQESVEADEGRGEVEKVD